MPSLLDYLFFKLFISEESNMSNSKEKMSKKLTKLSEEAVGEKVQHLLLVVGDDGDVSFTGSLNIYNSVSQDEYLLCSLKDNLKEGVELPWSEQFCRSVVGSNVNSNCPYINCFVYK